MKIIIFVVILFLINCTLYGIVSGIMSILVWNNLYATSTPSHTLFLFRLSLEQNGHCA